MPLAPSGSGRLVWSNHHWPRSTRSFQRLFAVGELSLVDDQAGIDGAALVVAGNDGVEDPVEGHDHAGKRAAQAHPQRQVGGRERAGDGDGPLGKLPEGALLACDDHRPVTIAHAGPAGAEHVAVGQIGIGVKAEGGQFQFAGHGAAVERLDIDHLVPEPIAARIDLVPRQGVEHEGVVGIGAVPDTDLLRIFHE